MVSVVSSENTMDLLKALKSKGRTVQELVELTGMSRGGVVQGLRRNRKYIKKVGSKREHERGPESTLYQLKANAVIKAKPKGRTAKKVPEQLELADALEPGETVQAVTPAGEIAEMVVTEAPPYLEPAPANTDAETPPAGLES